MSKTVRAKAAFDKINLALAGVTTSRPLYLHFPEFWAISQMDSESLKNLVGFLASQSDEELALLGLARLENGVKR